MSLREKIRNAVKGFTLTEWEIEKIARLAERRAALKDPEERHEAYLDLHDGIQSLTEKKRRELMALMYFGRCIDYDGCDERAVETLIRSVRDKNYGSTDINYLAGKVPTAEWLRLAMDMIPDDDIIYQIPGEIRRKIPEHFYHAMFGELVSVFGPGLLNVEEGDLQSSTYGWASALWMTCRKLDMMWLYEYWDKLSWQESDIFDEIIEKMICKVIKQSPSNPSTTVYANYLYEEQQMEAERKEDKSEEKESEKEQR